MTELIIIKTNEGEKIRKLLAEKHINYEIYQEEEENPNKNISDEELGQAYRETWVIPKDIGRLNDEKKQPWVIELKELKKVKNNDPTINPKRRSVLSWFIIT